MKIAMIYDAWDVVGGGRIHVENICKQLILNHDCNIDLFVRAITTDEGVIKKSDERLFDGKLHIIRCGRSKRFFNIFERFFSLFSMLSIFLRYNKKEKYTIIHAHTYLPLFVGKIGSIVTKIPVISTVHGSQIMDIGKRNLAYYIQKRLLTKVKYNLEICVGKNFMEYPNKNEVVNIGNGVNMKEFSGEHYVNHHIKKLLFVGRLEWTKGVDILIDAMQYVVCVLNINDIILDIVGYGYDEKKYHDQVKKYGLEKYVIFHGTKQGAELVKFYKHADLMVVPSRAEGFGIIILEAMASGVPVIATKSGGPEDIIQDEKNGFLVPKDDAIALAKKIYDIVFGKEKHICDIVESGYITIQKKYTWERISDKIFNQYMSLISK